jgi:S-adenosylmethionine:tRNA ribosyltransferase-isomerase
MATSRSLPLTVSFGFLVVRCAFNRRSTKPIPRTGPSASGSIGGIRQFAFVDGKASASDTLRQAILDTLEFDDPLVDPLRPENGCIVAIGTTVVRALESAANADGSVRVGDGVASGRITRETRLQVVDTILTGVHEPGGSHFQLLRAFADDTVLQQVSAALKKHHYHTHEFGDFMLIERQFRR